MNRLSMRGRLRMGQSGGKPPAAGPIYLLRDEFTTASSAPLSSPRTCEPGPGTLMLTQSGGQFSISGGKLNVPAQTSPGENHEMFLTGSKYNRSDAPLFVLPINFTNSFDNGQEMSFGWSANAPSPKYDIMWRPKIYSGPAPSIEYDINNVWMPAYEPFGRAIDYKFGIALRKTAGALFIVQGGPYYKNPTLVMVDGTQTQAQMLAGLSNWDYVGTIPDLTIEKTTGKLSQDYGLACGHVAAPAVGETLDSPLDGIIEINWTPAANENLDIMFRRTDDNNCEIARFDQANSLIRVIDKEGGSEAQRTSKAATFTVGTTYNIRVIYTDAVFSFCTGPVYYRWVLWSGANRWGTSAKVSGFTSATDFTVWPRIISESISGDFQALTTKTLWMLGDSKGNDDIWQPTCRYDLNADATQVAVSWVIDPGTYGRTGARIGDIANTYLAPALAVRGGNPGYVLINLGVNNFPVNSGQETTVKADFNTILNQVHTKWPNALIWLARPWNRDNMDSANMLAGWIADVVGARTYCRLGIDERIVLENGDNGATMTTDGTHYSTAGKAAIADAWKTVVLAG